jgi:hypothetical protein
MSLFLHQDGREVRAIEIGASPVHLGRETNNSLVFSDVTISNDHATVWSEGGHVWLRDRSSTNGTFVNDTRVRGTVLLHAGDMIRLGTTVTLVLRGRLDSVFTAPQTFLLRDLDTGMGVPVVGDRFYIGSGPNANMKIDGSEHEAAIINHDGELWLETYGDGGPIVIGGEFRVGNYRLRLEAPDGYQSTIEVIPAEFPYRLTVTLDGASGATASLEDTVQGIRHVIAAENRAVLLYVLAKQLLEERKKGDAHPGEAGWCNDDDVARDIWGKKGTSDANSLHVLVHRLRKEIKKAGFDPWFIEKRRRAIRIALSAVVLG